MKIAVANKYNLIVALVLGAIGVLVGIVEDVGAPCKETAESFLASSPQITLRIGRIDSFNLRRRISVNASTTQSAYIIFEYIVRGELAAVSVVLKTDPTNCSCVIESVDPI